MRMWLVLAVSVATVMSTFVVLVCFLKLAKRLRQRRYAQKRLSLQRAAPVDPAEAEKRRKRIEAIKRVFRVCFKAILGVAGVCLVCLATALILFVYYYGLVVALPLLVAPGSAESFFHQVMGSFIVVNILFNYYMAVFTNPGDENSPYFRRAEREAKERGWLPEDGVSDSSTARAANPMAWSVCQTSGRPKPPRSHFDNIRGSLVLNMDHFCPWVFNTIGYANYRYFVLFLFHTFLGALYFVIMVARLIYRLGNADPYLYIAFVVAFSFSIVLLLFLLFQSCLISTGYTTVDFWKSRRVMAQNGRAGAPLNPFDLGPRRNWERVFGRVHWMVALLPSIRAPPWPPYAARGVPFGQGSGSSAAADKDIV